MCGGGNPTGAVVSHRHLGAPPHPIRLREVKGLTQGHPPSLWQSREPAEDCLVPRLRILQMGFQRPVAADETQSPAPSSTPQPPADSAHSRLRTCILCGPGRVPSTPVDGPVQQRVFTKSSASLSKSGWTAAHLSSGWTRVKSSL